eukprot:GHVR01118589.1.p1 GENE.GHVR01118589.1~~GHVR01118589.1.p1  ORF type:complete len:126 (+),score=4.46 GHVR01118589.1:94-471(+)
MKELIPINNYEKPFTLTTFSAYLKQVSIDIQNSYYLYIKKKIIKICSVTKNNNLLKFYEYKVKKMEGINDINLLNIISDGKSSQLYVLEARYLLGKYYHYKVTNTSGDLQGEYRAFKEYSRATKS